MIACEAVRERAQAYLDDELDAKERERFERHLSACPACRRVLSGYRRLFAVLDEPAIPDVAAAFAARTMARVAIARRRRRAWQSLAAAAAMLLAIGAALLAWGEMPDVGLDEAKLPALQEVGRSAWSSAVALGEEAASVGGEWVSAVPGGPSALLVALVLLGAEASLVYRWRLLARAKGDLTRVLR
jgi:anti-sigma factor RsiW